MVIEEPHYQAPINEPVPIQPSKPTIDETSIYSRVNIDVFRERTFPIPIQVTFFHLFPRLHCSSCRNRRKKKNQCWSQNTSMSHTIVLVQSMFNRIFPLLKRYVTIRMKKNRSVLYQLLNTCSRHYTDFLLCLSHSDDDDDEEEEIESVIKFLSISIRQRNGTSIRFTID